MDINQENNIVAYQKLPPQIRQQIHQNYFFQRQQFSNYEKQFYRYMQQIYNENEKQQIIVKEFYFSYYKPNSSEKKAEERIKVSFNLNKDIFYLMGSLKELPYINDNKEKKTFKICDVYNQYLNPLHFEISLPQTLEINNEKKLESNFNNYFLAEQLKKMNIEQLNFNEVLFRDISQESFSTYLMNNDIIKLSESNNFAFETSMEPNLIRYFSVKNNNKRYFFDNQNTGFDLTFIVGISIEDQQIINENIFKFCLIDEHDPDQFQEYIISKGILEITQKQLQQQKNALRIKIFSCEFDVIVHPNNENQYIFNQDKQTDIFNNYLQQVQLYEDIMQQLKYENDEWTLNLNKEDKFKFYKYANHYPDHFYLSTKQTALIKCKNANIKLSQNHLAQTEKIQQS